MINIWFLLKCCKLFLIMINVLFELKNIEFIVWNDLICGKLVIFEIVLLIMWMMNGKIFK